MGAVWRVRRAVERSMKTKKRLVGVFFASQNEKSAGIRRSVAVATCRQTTRRRSRAPRRVTWSRGAGTPPPARGLAPPPPDRPPDRLLPRARAARGGVGALRAAAQVGRRARRAVGRGHAS